MAEPKDLIELWQQKSAFLKILAVIGLAGFIAGSIASVYNLRTVFFTEKSEIPQYRAAVSDLAGGATFDAFIRRNVDKIVYLNMTIEQSAYVRIDDRANTDKGFSVFTDCDPDALQELKAGNELSKPTSCRASIYSLRGDQNNYLFGRSHFYHTLKGHFFIEDEGTQQGQTVVLLKAIAPGDLASFINARR